MQGCESAWAGARTTRVQARASAGDARGLRRRISVLAVATVAMLAAWMLFSAARAHAAPVPNTALILADSVTTPGPAPAGPTESLEQYEAEQDGFTVTAVDGATWDSMTAAQFAAYQVIIIGDPTCGSESNFAAAETNASVWEPVVMSSGGNKVLIGTDPTYHYTFGGVPGNVLEKNGIAFAGAVGGATGAYVDLSCAYDGSAPGTAVPFLDGLSSHGTGSFTVGGAPCAGAISIIAQSGPTSGLNDSDLSNWNCSVHEFFDKFPSDYTPLALATDPTVPVTYTGTDVNTGASVSGSPYIMLSGAGVSVKSNLVLSPATQTQPVGGPATVTGNLTSGGSPVSGNSVTFDITSGPDSGATFTGTTDASGNVPYTFTNTGGAGTDQVVATTVVSGVTQQGTAQVTFTGSGTSDPPIVEARGFTIKCVTMCKDVRTVGRFEDTDKTETGSDYTATINWGDGTATSAGTITKTGNVFYVTGQHGYAAPGTYTITVTIADSDGPTEPAITSTANISARPTGGSPPAPARPSAPAVSPPAKRRAVKHSAKRAHAKRTHRHSHMRR